MSTPNEKETVMEVNKANSGLSDPETGIDLEYERKLMYVLLSEMGIARY